MEPTTGKSKGESRGYINNSQRANTRTNHENGILDILNFAETHDQLLIFGMVDKRK